MSMYSKFFICFIGLSLIAANNASGQNNSDPEDGPDLVIIQKMTSNKKMPNGNYMESTIEIKIKGTMTRTDIRMLGEQNMTSEQAMIFDTEEGSVTYLMPGMNSCVKMNKKAQEKMMKQATMALARQGDLPADELRWTPTEKSDTVNGYEATEYVYENEKHKYTVWVSEDDTLTPLKRATDSAFSSPITASVSQTSMPSLASLRGFPVRITIVDNTMDETVTTHNDFVGYSWGNLDSSLFVVPDDCIIKN